MLPRSARVLASVLLLAGPLSLAGCTSGADPSGGQGRQGYVSGDGTVQTMAASDRSAPVRFAGRTLDGAAFDVRDHRGRVVVVNVWGSWCPPCIAEAPALQAAWQSLRGAEVTFVGINVRDNTASARAHERRFGVTYPSVEDQTGSVQLALRGELPPGAIPSTLVLDRRGRVAARVLGEVTAATLRTLVRDTLAEDHVAAARGR